MSIKSASGKVFIPIFLLILMVTTGYSQQVVFKASARDEVAVGDQFRLIFTVNGAGNGFKSPVIRDFSILSGPNRSVSSSMEMINNQVTRSEEYSFTYVLQAIKEGKFTIGSASVNVDGKVYTSDPITINVVKGNPQQPSNQSTNQPTGEISSKNLFVKASVSNNNPYQGEQVIVTYRIYTRVPIANYSVTKIPSLTGFWKEDLLKDNTPNNQYRENINGMEYVVAEFKKDALFAQKSGKLIIEPLEVDVIAQIEKKKRRSNDPFEDLFNDSFFGGGYENIKKTIYSNALTLNVKPLPEAKKDADFNGAVGSFRLNAAIDKNKVKANDALTLQFTIIGSGNIKLIEKPDFVFPPDFEVYEPRIVDDIRTSTSGISGKRTFEYLLVPRNPGNYVIKPAPFVYFDLASGSYKRLTSPEFKITVEKGTGNETYVKAGAEKEDFQYIGTDIRYINTSNFELKPVNQFLFGSTIFWIILALPVILFILFLTIWQKELKKRANVALMRNKKATGFARKRLKAAEQYLKQGNQPAFCNEISNALWGYISDKFNISRSVLSIDSVSEALQHKNVKEDLISKFIATLNNCEFARFAPGDKSEVMGNLYSEALETITKTEQELK